MSLITNEKSKPKKEKIEETNKYVIDKLYKDCDLKENVRAQELELEDFIRLYEVLRCI